ncbi:MAG: hypothetical protein COW27_02100 [Nitrosopumilales archaeon CG15_BIG_FIL_POST_REV_8_21_14_020_37_12]|nr:MAG: hypothetical protein COW27_02100 [Nitrosopumilales archaeon CG15_BIG_FIL_POST_REV_8_21_14_020_37_12]
MKTQSVTKRFKCADTETNCDWSATAKTKQDLIEKVMAHANKKHGMSLRKVKVAIKDE